MPFPVTVVEAVRQTALETPPLRLPHFCRVFWKGMGGWLKACHTIETKAGQDDLDNEIG